MFSKLLISMIKWNRNFGEVKGMAEEGNLGKKAQSSIEVGGWEWTDGEC